MNKTISLIILVSAALHALVLGLVDFNSPEETISAGSLLRINIQAPASRKIAAATMAQDIAKPVPKKPSAEKTKNLKKIKPVHKNITTVEQFSELETNQSVDAPSSNDTSPPEDNTIVAKLESTTHPDSSALPESVSSLLHSDLERAFALHFYYPRIAIKRGWQGDVMISLRIEADGHLTLVKIINSSGYNLLDKAAISSIDKVEILPAAVALLDGRTLDLILPVEYRLL